MKYEFFCIFGILLFTGLANSFCKNKPPEFPPTYLEYPTDSTIQIIQSLPAEVAESSGIIMIGEHLWTHNDSGDDPNLYQIDLNTGELLHQVTFTGAAARDWEDVTQDSLFVYVGDFGNNAGKRRDLTIYKMPKSELGKEHTELSAQKIQFEYPDRTNFTPGAYRHNFDCEALFSVGDSLFLLSKNHLDQQTRLYTLPKKPGTYMANLKSQFDTKGMITGADMDPVTGTLGLVGYYFDPNGGLGFAPFVWLFWDYAGVDFFGGKSTRINLPFLAQAEGICHHENGQFLVSTEKSRIMRGKIMLIDVEEWVR